MHGAAVKTRIYTNESNHRLLQIWMNCRAKIDKDIGKNGHEGAVIQGIERDEK